MFAPKSTRRAGRNTLQAAVCLAMLLTLLPAPRAQTVIQGYEVQTWAMVTDPVDISVASDGALFVGRDDSGSGGSAGGAVSIHRVAPDGSVATYGPPITDPDTVVVDPDGDVGSPGSVLVGGFLGMGIGWIVEVDDQQNSTPLFGPSPLIVNPHGMVIEASGTLLVTDSVQGIVFRLINMVPTMLITGVGIPVGVDVEPSTGNLAVGFADGVIRRFAPDGTLLDNAFGSGAILAYHPITGDLWAFDANSGEIQKIQPDGTATVIGTGFQTVYGMEFDDAGNLFLTEFDNDRVLRVRPSGAWTDLGGGTNGISGQPILTGSGPLIAGTTTSVSLTNAPASVPMLAWVSFAPTPFMALSGTVHAFPFASQLFLFSNGAGQFSGSTSWPAGIPPGTNVSFQFVVQDVSSLFGLTLSNGLRATTP